MGKAEIIAQLPVLSPQDLADVRSKLDELAAAAAPVTQPSGDASGDAPLRPARIATPRLADPRQAKDFRKHMTELARDAAL